MSTEDKLVATTWCRAHSASADKSFKMRGSAQAFHAGANLRTSVTDGLSSLKATAVSKPAVPRSIAEGSYSSKR